MSTSFGRSPAQMSPLSKDGDSIDTRQVNGQSGVLTYINDIFRPANYFKNCVNFHQFKQGVFSSGGGGWIRDNASALNSGATGLEFGSYISATGIITILAQFGSELFAYTPSTSGSPGTGAGTVITGMTGLSATAIPCMQEFAPSIATTAPITVYCNGVAEPRKILTASTSAALLFNSPGVWPGTFNSKTYTEPKLCAAFSQRMAYTGFATTGASGVAIAYDLLISNYANAEGFTMSTPAETTDGIAFTIPGRLGIPTSLRSYKINNNVSTEVLIVGCQRGVCIISGTDPTNYQLQILTYNYGIPCNRTWVQLDSMLLYLADDGVRVYTGEQNNPNLLTETLTLGIYDQIKQIDWSNIQNAHATHHKDTQEVIFWVPYLQDGGVPQHALVMNYNTVSGNPIWYFLNNTVVMASTEFNRLYYGMTQTGFVQLHFTGNSYDGSVVNLVPGGTITLSLISVGNPSQGLSLREICVITDGGPQECLINADVLEKMDDGSLIKQRCNPSDYEISSPNKPQTVFGTWTIGRDAFPGNSPSLLDNYAPIGRGRYFEITLTVNDSSHNLDFAALQATISIGGMRI